MTLQPHHERIFLKAEDLPSDKIIMAKTAMMFYNDVDKSQHPVDFFQGIKDKFGSLNSEDTYKKWADDVFSNTMILDSAKWAAFMEKPDAIVLAE